MVEMDVFLTRHAKSSLGRSRRFAVGVLAHVVHHTQSIALGSNVCHLDVCVACVFGVKQALSQSQNKETWNGIEWNLY